MQEIAKFHGGSIKKRNVEGRGIEFVFKFLAEQDSTVNEVYTVSDSINLETSNVTYSKVFTKSFLKSLSLNEPKVEMIN